MDITNATEFNNTYIPVFDTLTAATNNTQYFSTFFSWIVVCFTYFTIGVRGGSIWRYLLYVTTIDFLSSFLGTCYDLSYNLHVATNFFAYLTWIEGICWGLSEWGYVYINFIKIKTCIKIFKKRYWQIIMYLLLINCAVFHSWICHYDYIFKINGEYYEKRNNSEFINLLLSFLFFPLGSVCVIFFYYNVKALIKENDKDARNNNKALLRSNLTRMLLVTTVFIGYFALSVFIYFYNDDMEIKDTIIFLRELLWKVKGSFGIIFLVDLLLLRIDIDHGNMSRREKEMQEMNSAHSTNEMPLLEEEQYTNVSTKSGPSYQYKRKKSTIEYASELLSNNSYISKTPSGNVSDVSYSNQVNGDAASTISINRYKSKRQSHLSGIEARYSNPRPITKRKSNLYNMYSKSPLFGHSKTYNFPSTINPPTTEQPTPDKTKTIINPKQNQILILNQNQIENHIEDQIENQNQTQQQTQNEIKNQNETNPSSTLKSQQNITVDITKKQSSTPVLWNYMFEE